MAEIGSTSRYRLTPRKVDDLVSPGRYRFEIWREPEIDMTEHTLYSISSTDLQRLDLIAYKTLGNVNFWWAIALVNNIANPLEDLVVGSTLKIPTSIAIAEALAQQEVSTT